MKTTFAFVFSLLFILNAFGQSWCPPQAIWHHQWFTIAPVNGYLKMEYARDTIIQSINCKLLEKTLYGYDFSSQQSFTQAKGLEFTYESNSVVYIYDSLQTDFDTLFNLNASPGDFWTMAKTSQLSFCTAYARVTVQDTGSRMINGVNLKWLKVLNEFDAQSGMSYSDTIFEKLGATQWYFFPYQYCEGAVDQDGGGPFRCYSDSLFPVYNVTANSCDFTVGVNEINPMVDLSVYPNPADNNVSMNVGASNVYYSYAVFNLVGEIVVSGNFLLSTIISVSEWEAGVYFLFISDGNSARVEKIIKQ